MKKEERRVGKSKQQITLLDYGRTVKEPVKIANCFNNVFVTIAEKNTKWTEYQSKPNSSKKY